MEKIPRSIFGRIFDKLGSMASISSILPGSILTFLVVVRDLLMEDVTSQILVITIFILIVVLFLFQNKFKPFSKKMFDQISKEREQYSEKYYKCNEELVQISVKYDQSVSKDRYIYAEYKKYLDKYQKFAKKYHQCVKEYNQFKKQYDILKNKSDILTECDPLFNHNLLHPGKNISGEEAYQIKEQYENCTQRLEELSEAIKDKKPEVEMLIAKSIKVPVVVMHYKEEDNDLANIIREYFEHKKIYYVHLPEPKIPPKNSFVVVLYDKTTASWLKSLLREYRKIQHNESCIFLICSSKPEPSDIKLPPNVRWETFMTQEEFLPILDGVLNNE